MFIKLYCHFKKKSKVFSFYSATNDQFVNKNKMSYYCIKNKQIKFAKHPLGCRVSFLFKVLIYAIKKLFTLQFSYKSNSKGCTR